MADNRYNTYKYGTAHKYGASTFPISNSLAWGIEIDWDGDGIFDGTNEATRLLKAPTIKRGRLAMLRPAGQGFEPIRTGSVVFTLSNHDGRYDAWNSSSPLYPNVDIGKDVRIRVMDLSTGTVYNRFYGVIQDIDPVGYDSEAVVIIRAEDTMRWLRDEYTTINRPYEVGSLAPASLNAIMNQILNAVQWPSRWSRSLSGYEYSVRTWYASGDRSVGTELEDLGLSFFGYVFIDNAGRFVFHDKFSSQTPVLSISQTEMLKDIGNPQPQSIRRNVVKLRFHIRKSTDNAIVWEPLLGEPPIAPGDTREYFIEFTHEGYPAHLENIETSFRFSSDPSVFIDIPSTYSITSYGTRAFLSLTNNNSVPAYLFASNASAVDYVRGDITWTEKAETISSPRNPASVANQRALVLDSLWYQDKNQAFEFVDKYQEFISVLHKTPIIQIENRFAKQFGLDLFDIVTIDIPKLGISSEDFRIGAIEEEAVEESTQAVRTTFYLEPFLEQTSGAGDWGTGTWGTSKWSW